VANFATIDVFFPTDDRNEYEWIAIAHTGYVEPLTENCDQHERFESLRGLIHVIVWNGTMQRRQCYDLAYAYAKGEFPVTPYNDLINR